MMTQGTSDLSEDGDCGGGDDDTAAAAAAAATAPNVNSLTSEFKNFLNKHNVDTTDVDPVALKFDEIGIHSTRDFLNFENEEEIKDKMQHYYDGSRVKPIGSGFLRGATKL